MPTFNILLLAVMTGSLIVCAVTLSKVLAYRKRYTMPESKYTKLFGVFTKEHISMIYLAITLGHAIFTIWFLITL